MLALTIMLSMKFIGFLDALRARRGSQPNSRVVGAWKTASFSVHQILVPGMPLLIEIVILFDLLIVVACFGMLVRFWWCTQALPAAVNSIDW